MWFLCDSNILANQTIRQFIRIDRTKGLITTDNKKHRKAICETKGLSNSRKQISSGLDENSFRSLVS